MSEHSNYVYVLNSEDWLTAVEKSTLNNANFVEHFKRIRQQVKDTCAKGIDLLEQMAATAEIIASGEGYLGPEDIELLDVDLKELMLELQAMAKVLKEGVDCYDE